MDKPVLIIEDNEQNMYLFAHLLEKNGCRSIQAKNGMAGIELAVTQSP